VTLHEQQILKISSASIAITEKRVIRNNMSTICIIHATWCSNISWHPELVLRSRHAIACWHVYPSICSLH